MTELWKPACELEMLQLRAKMLARIRCFFQKKAVLEVETPLLCQATGTDPQLDFFSSLYHSLPNDKEMYLQTSPEFAMKRLLAAGSGSIFQICKAFRNGEFGRLHNPEFSILEWYRVDFSMQLLMEETTELLIDVLVGYFEIDSVTKISYSDIFEHVTGLDPLDFNQQCYVAYAIENAMQDAITICKDDHCMWLDFIFSYQVQPALEKYALCIVYGYPAIQSSLARINQQNPAIADRFEVFIQGVEIGNGFFELSNAIEQEKRFDRENQARKKKNLLHVDKDKLFLQALNAGLPECSGIAIGLDRLLMIMSQASSLSQVMSFPFDRA